MTYPDKDPLGKQPQPQTQFRQGLTREPQTLNLGSRNNNSQLTTPQETGTSIPNGIKPIRLEPRTNTQAERKRPSGTVPTRTERELSQGNSRTNEKTSTPDVIHQNISSILKRKVSRRKVFTPPIKGSSTPDETHKFISKILQKKVDRKYILSGIALGGVLGLSAAFANWHRQFQSTATFLIDSTSNFIKQVAAQNNPPPPSSKKDKLPHINVKDIESVKPGQRIYDAKSINIWWPNIYSSYEQSPHFEQRYWENECFPHALKVIIASHLPKAYWQQLLPRLYDIEERLMHLFTYPDNNGKLVTMPLWLPTGVSSRGSGYQDPGNRKSFEAALSVFHLELEEPIKDFDPHIDNIDDAVQSVVNSVMDKGLFGIVTADRHYSVVRGACDENGVLTKDGKYILLIDSSLANVTNVPFQDKMPYSPENPPPIHNVGLHYLMTREAFKNWWYGRLILVRPKKEFVIQ